MQPIGRVDKVLWLLLLLAQLSLFVPLAPLMPIVGIDPGWALAMNEAVARHMAFGRDIAFTFGPYGSIYTRAYHPATDALMLGGALLLVAAHVVCSLHVLGAGHRLRVLGLSVFFFGMVLLPDAWLMSYPLLVGLMVSKSAFETRAAAHIGEGRDALRLALALIPFGLLVLIKGSIIIGCVSVLVLSAAALALHRRWASLAVALVVPPLAALAFWLISGQHASDLAAYFASMLPQISGYTEAMSLKGKWLHIVLYAVAAVALLIALARQAGAPRAQRALHLGLFGLTLFLAFKAGFVRHDGHAIVAATMLPLALAMLPVRPTMRAWLWLALPALGCWAAVHYRGSASAYLIDIAWQGKQTLAAPWIGLRARLGWFNAPTLDQQFQAGMEAIRVQYPWPQLSGTSDVYSYGHSELLAAGANWSPRPVVQSYSAYTPALAERNRQHLLGSRAPHNIVFRIETIDGRLPALDDGPSWPVLLSHYRPQRMMNGAVLLQRSAEPSPADAIAYANAAADTARRDDPSRRVATAQRLNQPISLPAPAAGEAGLTQARLDIQPSLLGRLVGLLFKPPPLQIKLTLVDGRQLSHRLVSGMARAGFTLSPMVEDTRDFVLLYAPGSRLANKQVTAFEVQTRGLAHWLWQPEFSLHLQPLAGPAIDVSGVLIEQRPAGLPAHIDALTNATCDGSIDLVNGIRIEAQPSQVAARLVVNGWGTTDRRDAALPDALYLVLTDEQGQRRYLLSTRSRRPDVAQHFNLPLLADSGYHVDSDVAGLAGRHHLSLAMQQGRQLRLCNNTRHVIHIKG